MMMKIISPTLNIEESANETLIQEVISKLPFRDDPFVILERSELSYIQTVWSEAGYIIEYQVDSIDNHYISDSYLNKDQVIQAFKQYLNNEEDWQQKYEFIKKDVRGFWGNLGFALGSFFGGFARGLKDARKDKMKT